MRKLLLTAKLLAIAVICLWAKSTAAQTDITATYLVNTSFEQDDATKLEPVNNSADGLRGYALSSPKGWKVSGTDVTRLLVDATCYTDNNFGKVTSLADGSHAYYLRMGWQTGTTTMTQEATLPAGHYRLSVAQRTAYANNAVSTLTLIAGANAAGVPFQAGSTGCFTTMKWSTGTLDFSLSESTTVALGISIDWQSGGSCVMVDDIRLYATDGTEAPTEDDLSSPTEGVITHDFVDEEDMMTGLLQMLADFSQYMVADYQACVAPNSVGEVCGCFKGESTMASNEAGVRTNADLSMICAFLVKYARPAGIALPEGVTWQQIEDIAMKTLVFAYSTHKANRLKVCSGGDYWGSTATGNSVWESSLWAMSVAYSAFFQWDRLTEAQKGYIYNLLKAECNYELHRSIPTGYNGDTKAEENGWEADVLAATLGLFPDDELAQQWYERLRLFAVNSYSHPSDATDTTVVDSGSRTTVADLYRGQNLYDDYTLQNHNLFHTSYQNVVIQELGEAALALRLFQTGLGREEKWQTNALTHNCQEVTDSVLNWLALADGELAMPNGNDWSLFLYDQITSYSTMATMLRDPHALMLENLAFKYIQARQKTTADGSWLLRPDVQARRMGVEGHRVMMTYLMHLLYSTADMQPTRWEDFRKTYSQAKVLRCQDVVRAFTADRFTTFSWSKGLKSYTGYFAANNPDKNKIIVPFRANNTGNFLGWYSVSGRNTDATPAKNAVYHLKGDAYTMSGELLTNGSALDLRFAIYSTPGNAVLYTDLVRGRTAGTINAAYGGLLAVSVDEMTKTKRTIYHAGGHQQTDGTALTTYDTRWLNIDNEVGIVNPEAKAMAFGDRANNNSILTAKVYAAYSREPHSFVKGSAVDRRNIAYYSRISAEGTAALATQAQPLTGLLPEGWNGQMAADPDGTAYLLVAHLDGTQTEATLNGVSCPYGAPVFESATTISGGQSTATFHLPENDASGQTLRIFVKATGVTAQQDPDNDGAAWLHATQKTTADITIISDGKVYTHQTTLGRDATVYVHVEDGTVVTEEKEGPFFDGIGKVRVRKDAGTSYDLQGRPVGKHQKKHSIVIANRRKTIK